MRSLLRLLPLVALLWLAMPAHGASGDVTLAWEPNNPPSTNLLWVLKGSPTLSGAPTNWPTLTNVSGLSTTATVRITPGEFYFIVQSSNMWGMSPPSNVAPVPPLPLPPLLSIRAATP
jgi:hypothetical protein